MALYDSSFSMDQQFSGSVSLIGNHRSIGGQAKSTKHTKTTLKRHTANISLAKASHTAKPTVSRVVY